MSYDDWKATDSTDSSHFCSVCGHPTNYQDEPCSEECWNLWLSELRNQVLEAKTLRPEDMPVHKTSIDD